MMRFLAGSVLLLSMVSAVSPALANLYVEQSFQSKMADADIVIVATVVSMDPGHRNRWDATATVRSIAALKGQPPSAILVRTRSGIAESDSDCCQIGATYVMFLRHGTDGPAFVPVNEKYGLVRLGPARDDPQIQVVPPRQ